MSATTGYLADGRTVPVPADAVKDWKYEVENGDTVLGLGDWYTDCGDENMEAVEGSPDDSTRCDHEGRSVRVTNASQKGDYDRSLPHASTWVCTERACVLDAMAWVERATGEHAVWIDDADAEKVAHATAPLHLRQTEGLPLNREAAERLMLREGYASLIIEVPIDEMMWVVALSNKNYLVWDFLHELAFNFGQTYDSSYEILAVQGNKFLIQYSTNVNEIIAQSEEDEE